MIEQPRVAVLSGFGINCETETIAVFEMAGAIAERVHVNRLVNGELSLEDYHIMAVPGGFSFGDHLGSGRLMGNRLRFGLREQVREFVKAGKPVIGICNGFQVLCEAGLLPGALIRNKGLRFVCRSEAIEVLNTSTAFTGSCRVGDTLRVPVKHGCGCYVLEQEKLRELEDRGGVVFRYAGASPNGSVNNIAGVCNVRGNVVGLMPHPEHAVDPALGRVDGRVLFESVVEWARDGIAA